MPIKPTGAPIVNSPIDTRVIPIRQNKVWIFDKIHRLISLKMELIFII